MSPLTQPNTAPTPPTINPPRKPVAPIRHPKLKKFLAGLKYSFEHPRLLEGNYEARDEDDDPKT